MYMKRLYITLLITAITLTAAAIPAKRGQWKDVRLADGTTVRVEMRGDEHLHYWQSADGRVFQEDSLTGFYQPRNIAELLKKSQARRSQVRRLQQTRRQQAAKRQASFQGVKKGLRRATTKPSTTALPMSADSPTRWDSRAV